MFFFLLSPAVSLGSLVLLHNGPSPVGGCSQYWRRTISKCARYATVCRHTFVCTHIFFSQLVWPKVVPSPIYWWLCRCCHWCTLLRVIVITSHFHHSSKNTAILSKNSSYLLLPSSFVVVIFTIHTNRQKLGSRFVALTVLVLNLYVACVACRILVSRVSSLLQS